MIRDYTVGTIIELLLSHGWEEIQQNNVDQDEGGEFRQFRNLRHPSNVISVLGNPSDYLSPLALQHILKQADLSGR